METLFEAARRCLDEADPSRKMALTHAAAGAFARGEFDVQDEQSAAEGLFWCNVTGARHSRSTEGVSVFEASLVALLGVLILLASVNRRHRPPHPPSPPLGAATPLL